MRVVALEDEAEAAKTLAAREGEGIPDRDRLLDEMASRAAGRQGRRRGIHVHDVTQRKLVADRPWPIKHSAKDLAAVVVARLQRGLTGGQFARLADHFDVIRGIETGADSFTRRLRRRLEAELPDDLRLLEAQGARNADPILELPAGAESGQPWVNHPEFIANSIEPEGILWGALDERSRAGLVWIDRNDQPAEEIIDALRPWKPVLENRAEFRRNAKRRWFETAWPRDRTVMAGPKVIALYRTDRGRFGLDESGEWQPSNKSTLISPRAEGLSVAYLCGLLNSELLDLWYGVRGKIPRDIWRNYEPKPMNEMPYRHVEAVPGVERMELASLAEALENGALPQARDLVGPICEQLGSDPAQDALAAGAIVLIVRAIAANRRSLLNHRDRFPALSRIVKSPWSSESASPDLSAWVKSLAASETISIRLDPELCITVNEDGATLGAPHFDGKTLRFQYRRETTASVSGRPRRLEILSAILQNHDKLSLGDLEKILLPRDAGALDSRIDRDADAVEALLDAGRILVELNERLVCALYEVPSELEAEIIAHAQARSGPE